MRLLTSRNNSPGGLGLGADSGADPYAEAPSPSLATKPCCCCARGFFASSRKNKIYYVVAQRLRPGEGLRSPPLPY